jgi:hypothetical protein
MGLAWRIIMCSGFDDWVYWHFFKITVSCKSSTLNYFWTTCVWRISHCSLNLGLISTTPRIHECTAFYKCQAAGIEVTMSKISCVLFCCHGNAFVNILCRWNKCLLSHCLAKMTSASAIIPDIRQCLPSRCLSNNHIPSQYLKFRSHNYFIKI